MKLKGKIELLEKDAKRADHNVALHVPPIHYPSFSELSGMDDRWESEQAAVVIKSAIEHVIAHKRSGACSTWWTEAHEKLDAEQNAHLSKTLADWKVSWSSKGVDVETVLREVFNSKAGRVWELDPEIKRLARIWALGTEAEC